jgi:hypothetical protein
METPLNSYCLYVNQIENMAFNLMGTSDISEHKTQISHILDGQPSAVIRNLVSLNHLKQSGIFFTSEQMANNLVKPLLQDIEHGAVIADPACGTGNLLIACAKALPIYSDFESTLSLWGKKIIGIDIHPELVRATKARLALLAIYRGARCGSSIKSLDELLPNIYTADGLSEKLDARCIILNPPYSIVDAPKECSWASGHITLAALFMEKYLLNAMPNDKIYAVLPDVLRTGTRYSKWRKIIGQNAEIISLDITGQFDKLTDIDVFLLRLRKTISAETDTDWWKSIGNTSNSKSISTVGDIFDIHVGPVVPHRDTGKGPWMHYIHAKLLPPWERINIASGFSKRRFCGTNFKPPFVVVRRTSRPGDKFRATATLIVGKEPVAVENHLIVLRSRNGLLKDCNNLLRYLRSERVNKWLDNRIRCRHLTTSALRDLPLEMI